MPSPTELPQRQLEQELRFAIDLARSTGQTAKLRQLLEENPRGWESGHVRHNLGVQRVRWVKQLLAKEGVL